MGFCSDEEYEHFLRICPDSEQGLIEDGIILVKYWLQIDDDEQERRFRARIDDRRRRWKLSPMDSASWGKWVDYSRARDAMLLHTDTDVAPWYIVDANIRRNGRLNVIRHLLDQIPHEDRTPEPVALPPRRPKGDYAAPNDLNLRLIPDHYG